MARLIAPSGALLFILVYYILIVRQSYNSWSGLPGLPDLPRLHGASSASGLPRVLRSIGPIGSRVDCAPTVLCLVVSSESEGADFFKFHFSDIVAGVKCWVDLGPKYRMLD